ncbi:MAG: anthranilate phosphoribosyltransferase [Fibrobacter sp.]|jgi:anthranilate phosphoribosyltransferase|nr:anthranilate phosphoribosyltransferase [Fibrobacter sp.]
MTIQEAIKKVIAGNSLSIEESTRVFSDIMSGSATDAQIAALIVSLRMKGESVEEITGAASVMREKATLVCPKNKENVIDTCGTGGDNLNTFNISTASAFVAAGAGATVAKHGNRSVSSKCGSADVLESLGVNISISPDKIRDCLDKVGIGFLFAVSLHKAMKYAIAPRKEIGVRTIFNILGPLTNPAMATSQLMGVFSPSLTETMALVLRNMGSRSAFVVHGLDSLDEISLSSPTQVSELKNGTVKTYTIQPEDFGLKRTPLSEIKGGDPSENAVIIRDVLNGKPGPQRDIVILNSAFALAAAGLVSDPKEGIELASKTIDSGDALRKLEELVNFTNS